LDSIISFLPKLKLHCSIIDILVIIYIVKPAFSNRSYYAKQIRTSFWLLTSQIYG
jgi:hypothetical protein